MAYLMEFDHRTVRPFLRDLSLSRTGRVKLFAGLRLLCEQADTYRNEPSRRLSTGSTCFWFDYLLIDEEGDGDVHHFVFIVDDAAAPYGVLKIVYVEKGGS